MFILSFLFRPGRFFQRPLPPVEPMNKPRPKYWIDTRGKPKPPGKWMDKARNFEKYAGKIGSAVATGAEIYKKVKPYYDAFVTNKDNFRGITLTKERPKTLNARTLTSISGEITTSKFSYGQRYNKYYERAFKESQPYTITNLASNQAVSSTGAQGMFDVVATFTSNEIRYFTEQLLTQTYNAAGTANTSQKFGVRSATLSTTFSNSGNNNMVLHLAEIIPRRDQFYVGADLPPYFAPTASLQNSLVQQPSLSVGSSAVTSTIFTYGTNYYLSAVFNFYWKIAGTYKVILAPGSSHTHTSEYFIHKSLNSQLVTGQSFVLTGVSHFLSARIYGMPVHDKTSTTSVSVGPTRLDYVTTIALRYDDYSQTNTVTVVNGSLPSVPTPEQFVVNNPTDTATVTTG